MRTALTNHSIGRAGHVLVAWAVVVCLAATLPAPAAGQPADTTDTHTVSLRDVPLDAALRQFLRRTRVNLAYSDSLVEGRTVYCHTRDATPEELLACILGGTGVDYLRTDRGSYLLVSSPEVPPAKGRIAGTVVDATTGEPLPSANVLLADASTGTATNEAGQFTVAPVVAGPHRLVVSYVGYATAVDSVRVPPNGRDTIRIALDRRILDADPIVVDGLQQRLPSGGLGKSELDPPQLTRLTGRGTADVIRSTSRQVGVSLNRPLAEVSVQGGGSGEHVMLLDGVPVREPVTLGRLIGAFSPQALERLTVHKAGFGASHGSYTAGVMEASHDLSRSTSNYGAGSVDFLSSNARADAEWAASGLGPGRAMIAGRQSMWDLYRSPALRSLLDTRTAVDRPLAQWWTGQPVDGGPSLGQKQAPHVQFTDLHGAVRQEITPFQHLYVSGYHGTTALGADVASVVEEGEDGRLLLSRDEYEWRNSLLQGRYHWMANSRVTGTVQVRGSRHDMSTRFGLSNRSATGNLADVEPESFRYAGAQQSREGNEIAEIGIQADVDVSLSSNTHMSAGIAPQYLGGAFRVRNQFLGLLQHETHEWQLGSYVEAQTAPGLNLTATAGTRLTYIPARRTVYAEPRLALRYDRSSTPLGGLAVRLAGGLYRQYVLQSKISSTGPTSVVPSIQFWLPIDHSLAPPRTFHTAGSMLLTPTAEWSLRLEAYHKWQPRTLHVDYANLVSPNGPDSLPLLSTTVGNQSGFMAAGSGRAFGTAVHVQRDGERVSGRLSAEWSRARRRYPDRFDDRRVPAPWSQPFRLTSTLDVALTHWLDADAQWQGIWGRPWALRRAYYDYLALVEEETAFAPFDPDRPGEHTLAPFSRLDLGLSAETTIRDVTVETEVSLVNVLGRRNAFDWSLDPTGDRATPIKRALPGRRAFVLVGLRF